MAFGDALRQHINRLHELGANVPDVIMRAQSIAIARAVEVATDKTPPNSESQPHGTGTVTGQSKAHWATDSITEPRQNGDTFTVVLANNMQWISYLNDGHRMDRHFVPGLMVNPYSGLLEKVPPEMGGIMVGVKTAYVPGLHMKEEAINTYENLLGQLLQEEIERLFNDR